MTSQPATPRVTPQPPSATDAQARFCIFALGDYRFALEGEAVRQVVSAPHLTPVPRSGSSLLGVFAVQGRVLGLVDLRDLLGLEAQGQARASDLAVIVQEGESQIGFSVDAVLGFATLKDALTAEIPDALQPFVKAHATYDAQNVFVLDSHAALTAFGEHVR